jgi:hypothetical protein
MANCGIDETGGNRGNEKLTEGMLLANSAIRNPQFFYPLCLWNT